MSDRQDDMPGDAADGANGLDARLAALRAEAMPAGAAERLDARIDAEWDSARQRRRAARRRARPRWQVAVGAAGAAAVVALAVAVGIPGDGVDPGEPVEVVASGAVDAADVPEVFEAAPDAVGDAGGPVPEDLQGTQRSMQGEAGADGQPATAYDLGWSVLPAGCTELLAALSEVIPAGAPVAGVATWMAIVGCVPEAVPDGSVEVPSR